MLDKSESISGNTRILHKLDNNNQKVETAMQIRPANHVDIHVQENGMKDAETNQTLDEKERDIIRTTVEKHHGNKKAAAKELGISERTLFRKIKEE